MFRTTYDFEIRNPVSSPLLPERLAGHDKRRKSDGESPQLYPSSDDEIMSLDASPCVRSNRHTKSFLYISEVKETDSFHFPAVDSHTLHSIQLSI